MWLQIGFVEGSLVLLRYYSRWFFGHIIQQIGSSSYNIHIVWFYHIHIESKTMLMFVLITNNTSVTLVLYLLQFIFLLFSSCNISIYRFTRQHQPCAIVSLFIYKPFLVACSSGKLCSSFEQIHCRSLLFASFRFRIPCL